jgi:hypothetical protein
MTTMTGMGKRCQRGGGGGDNGVDGRCTHDSAIASCVGASFSILFFLPCPLAFAWG